MNDNIVAERRRNPRFLCHIPRDYPVSILGKERQGRLANFCRDGIAFKTSEPLREDEVYQLGIKTDNKDEAISCRVRIMWVRSNLGSSDCDCGARFLQIDPSDKTDILDTLYQDWKQKTINDLYYKNKR